MAFLKKSPWVIHYDGSSCNGCDIEVLACLMPRFDVERLGIINVGNPKHADIFLVTGSVNEQNREVVQNIYDQMPDPKVVVAIGICATSGGIFSECYNVIGGINRVIPVDVYVPGCAARPEHIIDGVAKGLGILEEKRARMKAMSSGKATLHIETADLTNAEEILALQKLAYQSEAELYNDFTLSPLRQTIEEIKNDFSDQVFLKAVMDGKIVGSVRASLKDHNCMIRRLFVHPTYQNLGIGAKLMNEAERRFKTAVNRFEVFTGDKSKRNIFFYEKLGYEVFKTERISEKRNRVYLQKANSKQPEAAI
jgi:Ni,Fe-hydrogenase III small subunit/GNAT superfamily N-acetyltransferase